MGQRDTRTEISAAPCPGVFTEARTIRDACRVCGKCDAILRDLTREIVAAGMTSPDQSGRPSTAAV
jgi:hypothetical protein